MIDMLYVLLLEIILIACISCRSIQVDDDDHQLAIVLARAAQTIGPTLSADLTFPEQIESMYHAHGMLLHDVHSNEFETPFLMSMRNIANKKLQALFQEVLPEIAQICSEAHVSQVFQNVCRQAHEKVHLNNRKQAWFAFITKLAQAQSVMRSDRLTHIWFPAASDNTSEKTFILKNRNCILDKVDQKYLMVDTVITFLPFALMARHDPEMLAVTQCMQAR